MGSLCRSSRSVALEGSRSRLLTANGRTLRQVRGAIRRAQGVMILTGAGVSADSGISTFRDAGGLWDRYRPEELATPQAFRRDPRVVWEWYDLRRRAVLSCRPNRGHKAIAQLLLSREDVTLATQNVDGLHQRAFEEATDSSFMPPAALDRDSDRTLELHGSILRTRCSVCDMSQQEYESVDTSDVNALPHCLDCGAMMRPDVVWFGESLDGSVLELAFEAARVAEVCIVAGTSAVVQPAASIPLATRDSGGIVVEVNTEDTPLTSLSIWSLRGSSAEVLPQILEP